MERDPSALDGLLRELARAPQGDDDAFVARVMARTRPPSLGPAVRATACPAEAPAGGRSKGGRPAAPRNALLAAAALLLSMGFALALAPEAPTGRLGFSRQACLVPDAERMRILLKDAPMEPLRLLGEVPIDAEPRVPADTPIVLQAVGRDGMALWTAPTAIKVRKSPPMPGPSLDRKAARTIEFKRDVKPILDQHCAGCHAEADLVHSAVKPFEARRSPLVTQTHAPLSKVDRHQLALWVDLGAAGRP